MEQSNGLSAGEIQTYDLSDLVLVARFMQELVFYQAVYIMLSIILLALYTEVLYNWLCYRRETMLLLVERFAFTFYLYWNSY